MVGLMKQNHIIWMSHCT